MKTVSINIATYNRKALLDRTLESIFRQNVKDIEVIVIDDGSTDDTESLKDKYPIIYGQTGTNVYDARSTKPYNLAAEMSKGDIIIQQNAECYHWSDNVINRLVESVGDKHCAFATVFNLANPFIDRESIDTYNQDHTVATIMYSGKARRVAWFFCGAILKKDWHLCGGYGDSAPVDVNFASRMEVEGFTHEWLDDVFVIHQTHAKS